MQGALCSRPLGAANQKCVAMPNLVGMLAWKVKVKQYPLRQLPTPIPAIDLRLAKSQKRSFTRLGNMLPGEGALLEMPYGYGNLFQDRSRLDQPRR